MFISSDVHRTRDASIASEEFQVNPNYKWCVNFWYFMVGDGEEKLNVLIT